MTGKLERTLAKRHGVSFRSEGERRVAETLNAYGITFLYEPPISVQDSGTRRTLYPDFYLPDLDVYIEYYGRVGNSDYDSRVRRKQAAYAANGVRVLPLYPWDLCQDWPRSLLNYLEGIASERQGARDGGPLRATPGYRSRAQAPSYTKPSRRRYR